MTGKTFPGGSDATCYIVDYNSTKIRVVAVSLSPFIKGDITESRLDPCGIPVTLHPTFNSQVLSRIMLFTYVQVATSTYHFNLTHATSPAS